MLPFPFAAVNDLWYALPLIVAVSLVYAATRHEPMQAILRRALRVGSMIAIMMAILIALFGALSLLT